MILCLQSVIIGRDLHGFAKGAQYPALGILFQSNSIGRKSPMIKEGSVSLYFELRWFIFVLQNNEEAVKNIRKGGENLLTPSSPMFIFMLDNISVIWRSIIYLTNHSLLHCLMHRL